MLVYFECFNTVQIAPACLGRIFQYGRIYLYFTDNDIYICYMHSPHLISIIKCHRHLAQWQCPLTATLQFATPIRRAMECLNVNKMFETLSTFCHLKRKRICIRNHVWEKRVNAFGFSQTINHRETTVDNERLQSHFTNEKSGMLGCDKCSKKFQIKAGTDKSFHMGTSQNTVIATAGWSIRHVFTGPISQSIMGKLQLILKDFNQILLTSRLVCLVVVNVSKRLK